MSRIDGIDPEHASGPIAVNWCSLKTSFQSPPDKPQCFTGGKPCLGEA